MCTQYFSTSHKFRSNRASAIKAPDGPVIQSERGTAILELAVVVPLYVIIFFGLIDIGQAIRQQMIFEQITSTVGNFEGRIAELEPNLLYTNVYTGSPTQCPPLNDCPGHRLVQDRFRTLFGLHGWNVGPGEAFTSLTVQSRYVPFNIANPDSDVVTLEAWGTYSGVIPAVARTVSAKIQYPYLYDDVTNFGFSSHPALAPLSWRGFTPDDHTLVASQPYINPHGQQVLNVAQATPRGRVAPSPATASTVRSKKAPALLKVPAVSRISFAGN